MSQRLLVLGKRGGILQWYEHLLSAARTMPQVEVEGFALNHNDFLERTEKKIYAIVDKSKPDKITASNLQKKLNKFEPTIIVVVDLFYFSERVLTILNSVKGQCHIVHWIGDFFDERLINSRQVVDRYYFSDTGLVATALAMGLMNAEYLPLAYNPDLFRVDHHHEARSDELLFIGAWSENREMLMRAIEFPVRIIGKGWGKMAGTQHNISGKNIPIMEVVKLYQQHNFVLNNINTDNIKRGLNMRCFEAPACGALLITDDVADLKLCYEPGDEVVCYQNNRQLAEIYARLCEEPKVREIIQLAGTEKANQCHAYAHRLQSIIMNSSP
ncbi:MAG: glycosyltransferase [Pseudomonadales bacterium]|jgi:spore maturation protein CgeB|nr:glycosyltransferase [Pseudomonadales bacterium]